MAYRQADRQQRCLFPESLDDYVGPEDPVRAYDAFVDALDLAALEITWTRIRSAARRTIRV